MKRKTDHQVSEYVMGTARVLVWRLDEEAPRLLDLCREAGVPVGDLLEAPVKRQREKAAERLLLYHAFGRPVTLQHDEQGAPSIEGHEDSSMAEKYHGPTTFQTPLKPLKDSLPHSPFKM